MSLAFDDQTPPAIRAEAKNRLLAAADLLRAQIETGDGYRCASKTGDYYWGHNSNLLEKAHELAIALQLDPSRTWLSEAPARPMALDLGPQSPTATRWSRASAKAPSGCITPSGAP